MRPTSPSLPDNRLHETGTMPEPGYDAWAIAKIERALEQSRDPEQLISADQVWRDLGLET